MQKNLNNRMLNVQSPIFVNGQYQSAGTKVHVNTQEEYDFLVQNSKAVTVSETETVEKKEK